MARPVSNTGSLRLRTLSRRMAVWPSGPDSRPVVGSVYSFIKMSLGLSLREHDTHLQDDALIGSGNKVVGAREHTLDVPVDVLRAESCHGSVVGAAQAVVVGIAERGWLQCPPLFF